jgi:hypothetical protein
MRVSLGVKPSLSQNLKAAFLNWGAAFLLLIR